MVYNRMRPTLALLLLCVVWPTTAATPPAATFSASYSVHKGTLLLGEMHRSLSRPADAHYVFKTETYSTGLAAMFVKDRIVESSEWEYHNGLIRPLHYSYRKSGGKRERQLEQRFDWGRRLASSEGSAQPPSTLPLAVGTLDKLNYQIALMADLKQGKTELSYTLLDDDETKTYRFQVVGEETLSTPLGMLKTLRVERIMDAGSRRHTTFWCAPDLNYLLVRLDQRENDKDEFSALIQSVEGLSIP